MVDANGFPTTLASGCWSNVEDRRMGGHEQLEVVGIGHTAHQIGAILKAPTFDVVFRSRSPSECSGLRRALQFVALFCDEA